MTTPAYTAQQTADGNMVTYERVEFDKYSPTTLLDILERIPGIQDVIDQGNDGRRNNQRGFGSAGEQILINGKRLSAKTTSIRDILARTSASEVERVELIRGAADGLDVQTEGLLINVILSEIASTSSTFWKVVGTYMVGEKVNPLFELSHKGSAGNLDYTLVLEGERKQGYFTRDEIFYDENGLRTGEKDMDGSYRFRELTPSANLTYTFNNKSVLNLNGSYKPIFVQNDQIHIETGDDAETLFWDFEEDFFIWEVGGDYSITLGSLGKLKTLFLMNREYNADFLTDRFDGTGSQQYLYNKEIIDFQKHEDIFRTSLTRDLTPKQSLEVGGEASFNTIKQLFLNYERDIAVDPLELTTRNDIEVSEKRFEIFAHHNYTFSEKAVLQSSLTTEFSKITANTFLVDNPDIIVENNFTFFKPRFNFRYDLTKSDQYRLVAEKKISQLEFFHYFTFFDQQTKEIRKGNNDIKPEQIWEFSATYEHRLPNDAGTLEIKAFYHKYKDYIARADFTEYTDEVGNSISSDAFFALPPSTILRDDTDFSSKAGNVGDASVYGFEIKSNNRLSIIGLPDAHLNVGYKYRKPRYYDPFLQIDRQFSWWSEHEFSVDFRHDITDLKLSYGGGVKIFSDKRHTDINFDWKLNFSNIYEAFVEYKINDSIKLSIEGELPRGANQNAIFTRYRDHARFNELRGRNVQYNDRPVEIQFSLEGIF